MSAEDMSPEQIVARLGQLTRDLRYYLDPEVLDRYRQCASLLEQLCRHFKVKPARIAGGSGLTVGTKERSQ